jgi:hypothetical protein
VVATPAVVLALPDVSALLEVLALPELPALLEVALLAVSDAPALLEAALLAVSDVLAPLEVALLAVSEAPALLEVAELTLSEALAPPDPPAGLLEPVAPDGAASAIDTTPATNSAVMRPIVRPVALLMVNLSLT